MEHWSAQEQGKSVGVLTWEPDWYHADLLWLAADQSHENDVITRLVPFAAQRYSYRKRRMIINYPAGRGVEAFRTLQLQEENTLTWMVKYFR